jgi:hypothetical protein
MKETFFSWSRDGRGVAYTMPDERMQAGMCRKKR